MISILLFTLGLFLTALVIVLAICRAAARGDAAMEEFFRANIQHPTSNLEHPSNGGAR